jgi:hypothetical protein
MKISQCGERKRATPVEPLFEREEDPVVVCLQMSAGFWCRVERGLRVPAWVEVLLDVTAFAGFIWLASLYRGPTERHEPPHDDNAH